MPDSVTPRRALGWYQDPQDPARLRYWGERGWTNRRRPRPSWDLSSSAWALPEESVGSDDPVLEGPVRPAELPAIATAVSSARDSLTSSSSPVHSGRRRRDARVGHAAAEWQTDTGSRPLGWSGTRRPVLVFCLLSVLALAAMVTTVDLARPSTRPSFALDDPVFVSQADQECAQALPGLRITPKSGPATESDTQGIARLADRLGQLPVSTANQPEVNAWLADWHTYASDTRATAAKPSADPQVLLQASLAQTRADEFAVANGITACTLSAHPDVAGAQPY